MDDFNTFLAEIEGKGVNLSDHYTAIKYFGYYHTEIEKNPYFTTSNLSSYYDTADLLQPSNLSTYLGNLRDNRKEIKPVTDGYRLIRHVQTEINNLIQGTPTRKIVSDHLKSLPNRLKSATEQDFLREAIGCFSIRANRATIIMVWNLTIDHMHRFILQNELDAFNSALAKQTGVKITSVTCKDDFCELKESKFIEICRSGKIISNDVKKILHTKLGIRNSCAHPNDVEVRDSKVIDFIEDLVENIIIKYEI